MRSITHDGVVLSGAPLTQLSEAVPPAPTEPPQIKISRFVYGGYKGKIAEAPLIGYVRPPVPYGKPVVDVAAPGRIGSSWRTVHVTGLRICARFQELIKTFPERRTNECG
jgi:hypothetical protein